MRTATRCLLVLTTAASLSCAARQHADAIVGACPCSFWPPPRSTAVATANAAALAPESTLVDVAREIATALRDAGYERPRFYPVGVEYRHGFAVTTRLESIDHEGRPSTRDRWSSLYPDALTLRWLENARTARLPGPGRYRVFLIAFTDLPIGKSNIAPVWNEATVMEGPGVPYDVSPRDLPAQRLTSASYRVGFYVYEYGREDASAEGAFLPTDAALSAARHVEGAGLSKLGGTPMLDADPLPPTL